MTEPVIDERPVIVIMTMYHPTTPTIHIERIVNQLKIKTPTADNLTKHNPLNPIDYRSRTDATVMRTPYPYNPTT